MVGTVRSQRIRAVQRERATQRSDRRAKIVEARAPTASVSAACVWPQPFSGASSPTNSATVVRCSRRQGVRILVARQEVSAQDSSPMRRLLSALSAIWTLVGAFAPAALAVSCDQPERNACCEASRSGGSGAQIAGCAPCCACNELRTAPLAPVTAPERLSSSAAVAIVTTAVAALPVPNRGLGVELLPRAPELPRALGPPLRLRI